MRTSPAALVLAFVREGCSFAIPRQDHRWLLTAMFVIIGVSATADDQSSTNDPSNSRRLNSVRTGVIRVSELFRRSVTTTMPSMMASREVEVELPQYADPNAADLKLAVDNNEIKFLIVMPDRVLLTRLTVNIDGQPFRFARKKRIDKLLKSIENDVVSDDLTAERLREYSDATGRTPDANELQWLVFYWGAGAPLMQLSDHFERSRASQSPARDVLDRDGDNVLSQQEIASAQETLWRCDTNQNEVVELSEVRQAAQSMVSSENVWSPPQLMIHLDQRDDFEHALKRLGDYAKDRDAIELIESLQRFDADQNQSISDSEHAAAVEMPAEVAIRIDFDSTGGSIEVSGENQWEVRQGACSQSIGNARLQIAAVDTDDKSADQVSIGSVVDGYPIAPLLDQNEDGRLTIREMRQVNSRLLEQDTNGDGRLTADETPPLIRLSIGHGLCVHHRLGVVRSAQTAQPSQPSSPPDWFASLDKNRDGDLSEKEFVGTKQQFADLDTDNDQLISIKEALQNDAD